MRFAVFGAGRMGARHCESLLTLREAELAYVVDSDEERALTLAARFGARGTTDSKLALSDQSVRAVIIASPTPTHVDLIVAAAVAGKAVLCEKPIDLDISRVEYCEKALEQCQVPIMIGFQRRFDATHLALKRAIDDGAVGSPEVILLTSRDPHPPPHEYIVKSGGQFHDQMIHDFDMALWLSGAVGRLELFAMASNLVDPGIGSSGDTDTAHVLMRFARGLICHIDCSRRAVYGYDQRIEVFGSKGMVQSSNLGETGLQRYTSSLTAARARLLNDFMERYSPAYVLELQHFADSVSSGSPVEPDFRAGKRALLLADAARRSYRTGASVTVDLA